MLNLLKKYVIDCFLAFGNDWDEIGSISKIEPI